MLKSCCHLEDSLWRLQRDCLGVMVKTYLWTRAITRNAARATVFFSKAFKCSYWENGSLYLINYYLRYFLELVYQSLTETYNLSWMLQFISIGTVIIKREPLLICSFYKVVFRSSENSSCIAREWNMSPIMWETVDKIITKQFFNV